MLLKAIVSPSGAVATFWHPLEVVFDYRSRTARDKWGGWLDQQAFLDGRAPLMTRSYAYGPEVLYGGAVPVAEISAVQAALLRTNPEFADAQDAPPPPEPGAEPEQPAG